jgi:hypothetical protein
MRRISFKARLPLHNYALHNYAHEVKYEIGAIAMLALNKSAVRNNEPLINHGRAADSENASIPTTPHLNTDEMRGDIVLIRGCTPDKHTSSLTSVLRI